jgi:hypothetical protein
MTAPAENPAPPTAYRSACNAIERASLARHLARLLGQLNSIPDALEQLDLTDEELAWLRDHPGDLLSPGHPPRLGLGTVAKHEDDRAPTMAGVRPAAATS